MPVTRRVAKNFISPKFKRGSLVVSFSPGGGLGAAKRLWPVIAMVYMLSKISSTI